MDDYKGLYYKETKEQKFYEGGAHFPYEELYEILIFLKEEQDKKQKEELKEQNKNKIDNKNLNNNEINSNKIDSNKHIFDLIQNNKINNTNKTKAKTRNVNSCLYNNPNTLIKKNNGKNKNIQQINVGLSFNEKRETLKSRNYNNDYTLFYNRTSNQINKDDKNFLQETNISGIKTGNNLSNYMQKKYMGKNNSTNQIKRKKINLNNYLYSNIQKNLNRNNITEKNNRNDSYIINNNRKIDMLNNFEHSKNKNLNNSNNYSKGKNINSSNNKVNTININNFINNNKEHVIRRQRNFSGLNPQISHNINNYINVNINNNNNINLNINNVSYKNQYHNHYRNKNPSLNGILMTLNKSNNRKYSNKKEKDTKKGEEFIFDYIKINKSRNINKKSGLGHVKSMDYNNKPLTIELIGIENNTFYDKTFVNNNNNAMNKNTKIMANNNYKINIPKQLNKFGMNYSSKKMKRDIIKKNNIVFKPVKKEKGMISNEFIKKYSIRNNNIKINNNQKPKNEIISHKVNINKNNVINIGKYNMINIKKNNEIWSKYYGYFKKINKK